MADCSLADLRRSGVYEIVNTITGHRYVGCATVFRTRWNDHRHRMRRGSHHSVILQRAFDKYGLESLRFSILLFCDKKDLEVYEQACIDYFQPEYNILKTARTEHGFVRSPETREKMAAAKRGKKLSPEHRAKISAGNMGNKNSVGFPMVMSDEHRAKLLAGRKAAKMTPEWVMKARITKFERGLIKKDPRI